MKQIYVIFEDEEFKKLQEKKAERSWRDFILNMAKIEREDLLK